MNKTKLLVWAVALLAILNITTIATIIYHNQHENEDNQSVVLSEDGNEVLNGRYMRQIVGFDTQQMNAFRTAKHEFQPVANNIVFKIDSLKNEMFEELNKAKTDTAKLDVLSTQIGVLHAELKMKTDRFYLNIKSVCKPDQFIKLKKAFTPLFCTESTDCRNDCKKAGKGNGFRNQ
jgi:hypothetical protein